MSRLVVILGDQLSLDMSSLRGADPSTDRIVMGELADEASYVRHHKKKIAFLFSAMRHFAEELREAGWDVDYQTLDQEGAAASFTDLVARSVDAHDPSEIIVTEPGEWRVREEIDTWEAAFERPVDMLEDDRFLCSHAAFDTWAKGRKSLRMEYFYRQMREETGLLMDDGAPAGGEWNYDADNRKPPKSGLKMPEVLRIEPNEVTREVLELVEASFPDHFGDLQPFWFAVTRKEAEKARDHFFDEALACFGDYQDAMLADEKFLYHSLLSFYLNAGLLDAMDLCQRAEQAYLDGRAPLNAVEGFIRQILGWREYVRGIYWREGPDYVRRNALGASRDLPDFYWTGETDMACVRAVVEQTRAEAYAHHIQRLMVTGNFALIAGIDPHAVHEWYLEVYADAYEWVEAPNVIGMSQFADGGLLASKPYAASGAYINRMSDYCSGCAYKVRKKTESDACPLNALYWDFLARNEEKLSGNHRLGPIFRNWARMDADKKRAYRTRAGHILKKLDRGEKI